MTTLMVLLVPAGSDVLTVPLARVVGVLAGVLLSALVSTFLLPTTASCQALEHAATALHALARLAGGVWRGYAASLEAAAVLRPTGEPEAPPTAAVVALLDCEAAAEERAAVEGMLDRVLAALKQAAASQEAARKEVFMGRAAGGRLLLWLPAWPWADSPRPLAPPGLVADVVAAGRACVRLLWMLHAAQADGFAPAQLRSLVGVHSQQLLERLPQLAAAAFEHTAAHLEAALQRMHGEGGDSQQLKQQQRQPLKGGCAAAASKPGWQDAVVEREASADGSAPAPPAAAAAAAVQALADAVAALVRGSQYNRAALYSRMATLQAAAAGGGDSPAAAAAGGGNAGAAAEEAIAAHAAAAPHAVLLGTPRSSWHDAGSGAGIEALLRWHSLEFILERLAQHAAELQAAVAALAAALPA